MRIESQWRQGPWSSPSSNAILMESNIARICAKLYSYHMFLPIIKQDLVGVEAKLNNGQYVNSKNMFAKLDGRKKM